MAGGELDRMINVYWPAVAAQLAGAIDIPGVQFPPDIAKLVEEYNGLLARPDRLF